ncbi:hypothetical protein OZ668_15560 [Elizabethkingia sp. HX XZB]|uniref:SprT-like domain-containing protein n=1 Tax=Elizabethkingia sp. HX XZB TaxID=3003193 RepID=UPI002A23C3EB|nr:SprT-like domain-containing protein [Elizabethkingia sp. HX XZB]MDX8569417.1 hypothetical protein [Elizabethkingia sp. HX XZB]
MRKKLLSTSLWGIFALSLLSSCRTEDGAVTQKQIEDKRFAVFVPKDGKTVNYANAFAYLMRKYDKTQKTNLSGLNNTIVLNNLTASVNKRPLAITFEKGDTYVEFNIRTEIATETNGEKSIIYPKVKGNEVIGLVEAVLSQNETRMSYYTYNSDSNLYKDYKDDFQEALERYQKRRTVRLVAGIKPMADSDIEEVVIVVKRKKKEDTPTPRPPEEVGGCQEHAECIDYNPGGGGGNGNGEDISLPEKVDEISIEQLINFPCAFAIAQELPSLKNDLGTILNKIFKNSDKYKITFRSKSNMGMDDGQTGGAFNQAGKFFATIDLNEDVLKNATKEYILVTMYHEVIHAYLDFEKGRLGDQKFSEAYPMFGFTYDKDNNGDPIKRIYFLESHQEYGQFLDTLEDIIFSYNTQHSPNNPLSRETIRAMAKSGVTKLSQNEYDLNQRERGTNVKQNGTPNGTKCP